MFSVNNKRGISKTPPAPGALENNIQRFLSVNYCYSALHIRSFKESWIRVLIKTSHDVGPVFVLQTLNMLISMVWCFKL